MNSSSTRISTAVLPIPREHWFRIGLPGTSFFLFSWFLVFVISSMPIVEGVINRPPSLPLEGVVIFFLSVASAAALRQRYTWLGVALHIYSQMLIWLSIVICSLAVLSTFDASVK